MVYEDSGAPVVGSRGWIETTGSSYEPQARTATRASPPPYPRSEQPSASALGRQSSAPVSRLNAAPPPVPPAATVVPLRVTSSNLTGLSPLLEEVTDLLHISLPVFMSRAPTWLHDGYLFSLVGSPSAKRIAVLKSLLMCREAAQNRPLSGTVQSVVPLSMS